MTFPGKWKQKLIIHYIKDDCLCGKGIGTQAMDIIKNVARQLQ